MKIDSEERRLLDARTRPAICRLPDNQREAALIDALTYCYVVVGMRQENWPSQKEETMLRRFIAAHYGGHTAQEITTAFDMAVTGRLDLDGEMVRPYQNFSVEYFCKIMNAYRAWASVAHRRLEALAPPPEKNYTPEELLQIDLMYCHYMVQCYNKRLKKPLKPWTL